MSALRPGSSTVENLQFDRLCRSANSEAYLISKDEEALARVDLHFTADTVYGLIVVERDMEDTDIRALINRIDEDLVWTANTPREDFIVTVYKGEEVGVFGDEDAEDEDEED